MLRRKKHTLVERLLLLIFTFSASASFTQTNSDQSLQILYEKGIQAGERNLDSILYYVSLIKNTKSDQNSIDFYAHSLVYTYAYKSGDLAATRQAAFLALDAATKTNNKGLLADSYENLALYYKEVAELDSTTHYFKLAISKALEIQDETRFHRIVINYSNILIRQGKKEEAMFYVKSSIEFDSLYNKNANRAHNYHLLGNIHLYSGDYPAALEAYQISVKEYEASNNVIKRINVMNNIGLVYTSIGNYELAEKTYNELISLIDANNLKREKISALINLGSVYSKSGDWEKDKTMLEDALKISQENNYVRFEAQILNNLGNVAYYQGNYQLALDYFTQALEVNLKTRNKHEQSLCYGNMGWAYMMLNNQAETFRCFQKSLAIANEIKSGEKRMLALEGLSDANYYFKNFEKALEYKNQYMALKDSILGEKTQSKIAELETKYQTEKKENQIQLLQKEQTLNALTLRENELEISRLNWQRIGLALAILLLGSGAYIGNRIIKSAKEKEKREALLLEREKGIKAMLDATENERKRIARDLHDGVGQQMSGIKLAWQNISYGDSTINPNTRQKLDDLAVILDQASAEVRSISHQMMPKVLETFGLVPALEQMLENTLKHTPISWAFEHFNFNERINPLVELTVFRVAQELLSNLIKHAEATSCTVQLYKTGNVLLLLVEDNGKGFDPQKTSGGHGLTNIKTRLALVHGNVNFTPSNETGTQAMVRIELSA